MVPVVLPVLGLSVIYEGPIMPVLRMATVLRKLVLISHHDCCNELTSVRAEIGLEK